MNIFSFMFVLVLVLNDVDIISTQSEFVTILTPKFVRKNEPLNIYYAMSKAVDEPLDITIKYRWFGLTQELDDDLRMKEIRFTNNTNLKADNFKINIMLSRNDKNGTKMCFTKEMNVKAEKKMFNSFIQLDKPVYKPGDMVQFRVIVLDNNLKLFHINNIAIVMIDPLGNRLTVTNDLTDRTMNVIEEKFLLAHEVVLGDWRLEVTVDKDESLKISKPFAVQKYVLPPFEIFVKTNENHYNKESDVEISFYGRYSFEEYVIGKALLTITRRTKISTEVIYRKSELNVNEVYSMNWTDSSFPVGIDKAEYEVFVSIREPQSGYEPNSTTKFFIHKEQIYKIVPEHPKSFQLGLPFLIKIFVYDWKDNPVNSYADTVKVKIIFTIQNGEISTRFYDAKIVNGIASCDEVIDENVTNFVLEIKFENSDIYRANIGKGSDIMIKGFTISHSPEKPEFGKKVVITAKSESKIEKLYVIYSTQNGNVEKGTIACKNVQICKFTTEIDEMKMPSFTVSVFQVENRNRIISGKTTISTESLGENQLAFEVPKKAEPFTRSEIKFTATKRSRVYVLAFDKRLTYLGKGNDVTSSDVQKAYENYDGENNYLMLDLNINNAWHECKTSEKKLIESGRIASKQHMSSTELAVLVDDDYIESEAERSSSGKDDDNTNIDKVREDFPETWIFESFDIEGGYLRKFYPKVPHSITTWMMSAFAVSHDTSIAIAQPKELTVKIDFFIKINLPYSIRYKEVLRVDVLVYNYVQSSDKLTVDVQLENLNKTHPMTEELIKEFEFAKNTGNTCTFNKDNVEAKSASVKKGTVKKVSFYVRSNPQDTENSIERKILLQVRATARDSKNNIYKDAVRKRLLVEQVGILEQKVETSIVRLSGNSHNAQVKAPLSNPSYPKASVFIRGDRLSEKMNLNVNHAKGAFFPEGCADQRTSRLKGVVEYYRYLRMKNEDTSAVMSQINLYYTKLTRTGSTSTLTYWRYHSSSSYIAFFTDIFVSAMEIGAFSFNNFNQLFIEQDLDNLVQKQSGNGEYSCTNCIYPKFSRGRPPTERFFDTAYALIPFLKYKLLIQSAGMTVKPSYINAINNGLSFLKDPLNDVIDYDARAIIAYVYALSRETINARNYLDKIDKKMKIIYPGNKKCYRVSSSHSSCDFEMTVFVALAYITLNEIADAEPIIDYILEHHYQNEYYSNTYQHAIATEAIAKVAGTIKNDNTNIRITLSNERSYSNTIQITNSWSTKFQEISLPEYTRNINFQVSGYGYCAISTVFQFRTNVVQHIPFFNVTVMANVGTHEVQVCTTYVNSDQHPEKRQTLVNVIYEVETPSGFTYDSVVDITSHREYLREVEERNKKTLVILYFDQFHENRDYCVSLKLTKSFDVKNAESAGVKVYDYEHKGHFATEFYKMDKNQC